GSGSGSSVASALASSRMPDDLVICWPITARTVRPSGLLFRTVLLGKDGPILSGVATVKEEYPAHGRGDQCANRAWKWERGNGAATWAPATERAGNRPAYLLWLPRHFSTLPK